MANIDKKFIDWYTLQRPDNFLSSFGKETALQAYKRGPPSLVYMLQHSLQHVSYNDIVVVPPCPPHSWVLGVTLSPPNYYGGATLAVKPSSIFRKCKNFRCQHSLRAEI